VRKAHPTESFFNFFSPPVAPSEEAIEAEEIDEEELDELEEKLEIDYQIGEDIKEKVRSIWPSLTSPTSPIFLILYARL
jgi:nucleosome assembly protein 1-like 1